MNAPTRRTFLKTTATLAAALPLLRTPLAGATPAPAAGPAGDPARGLLFDPADLPRIRANLDLPRFDELRTQLRRIDPAVETKFLRDELRLNNHVADFLRAWQLLQNSAFAHAVWGEPAHLEIALLALTRLCDYKRWDYFLEGGKDTIGLQRAPEATIATIYALDWLGPKVPAELRARVEEKIATEGAPACFRTLYGMKHPDRVRGWGFDPEDDYQFRYDLRRWPLILNSTNLKVIPICGLGFAAIWLHGRHPDAEKWMQLARQSAQAFATMYGLDGAYDEGVGYWGYTTSHLIMFAEALHRRLGVDDRQLVNYPGTVRYALAMSMPCGGDPIADPKLKSAYNAVPKGDYRPDLDLVNFCDAGTGMDVSLAAWVGATANDPLSNHVAKHTGSFRQLQAAAWYRPDAPTQPPGPDLLDVRLSNDWVISRTGWAAPDTVVAFRSGGPGNHEHADRNSIIFKAHGERLFHDPFHAGYSPKVPRWLLRQTEAHTAVLIDGQGHQYHDGSEGTNSSWAWARVRTFRTGPGWMAVTSDATEAYQLVNDSVQRVARTLVFLKPEVLLVFDQVVLTRPQAVQLRFQAFNEDRAARLAADGASFSIARPRASVAATVHTTAGSVACAVGRLALPEDEGVFPYIQATSAPAQDHTLLTVATTGPESVGHGQLAVVRQGGTWTVTGTHRGRVIRASIALDTDGWPVVTV